MKFNIRSLAAFAMICFLTLFVGCGSGGGGSSTGGSGGTGTLALSLTDAPADLDAVYVTIERVEVHLGGNEASPQNWKEIPPPSSGVSPFVKKTYNLLELTNGVLEGLGMTELPAGHYTQMRLFIGEEHDGTLNKWGYTHEYANYVIESGATEVQIPMKVPSGTQTGIKLVKGFTVGKNQRTHLILDFDAAKSVHSAGNSGKYILQPTIKVFDAVVLGYYIEGTVFDEYGMPLGGASVSAQRGYSPDRDPDPGPRYEVVVENTTSSDEDGYFRLLVYPGTYNVVAYKDTYGFDYRCGVDAAADAVSGVTTELILSDLESGVTEYGYVGGDVTVASGVSVTISFRAPECEESIEMKSITVPVGQGPEHYIEILPVAEEPYYYDVVAWSGVTTEVRSGVTVQSEKTTVLDFDF
jgi:hypothetical protein